MKVVDTVNTTVMISSPPENRRLHVSNIMPAKKPCVNPSWKEVYIPTEAALKVHKPSVDEQLFM